jgi:hypothetical protein
VRGWRRAGHTVLLLDIVLIVLLVGSGPALGAGRRPAPDVASPIPLLGHVLDHPRCARVPLEVGKGEQVFCRTFSAITGRDGRVLVVSLYGPGHPVVDRYEGVLPEDLAWGERLADVLHRLGRPRLITAAFGTPTLVYMYDGRPYGSLELRFDASDRLDGINACLTH